jgi:N-acetylmuramoyl-L-alanine amidase
MLKFIDVSTSKFGHRAEGQPPRLLIVHSTDMPTDTSLEMLTRNPREVSVHYMICPKGSVYRMVGEDKRAWHAGKSFWRGASDINSASIGIELVWPADREAGLDEIPGPFPQPQMDALLELAQGIVRRWDIKPEDVLAHSDIAPGRKRDPGERFDWKQMAAAGLALLPSRPLPLPPTGDMAPLLARYGYDTRDEHAALIAFQKHFRQRECSGIADSETRSLLQWLLEKTGR